MDIYHKQYHTYQILNKIISFWPYDDSIYIWIQKLSLLMLFLYSIIFQMKNFIIPYKYNFILKILLDIHYWNPIY